MKFLKLRSDDYPCITIYVNSTNLQVEQCASSMVALTDEIEALKKKQDVGVLIQKSQISTSESVEKRIAEESSSHTCFQGENMVRLIEHF